MLKKILYLILLVSFTILPQKIDTLDYTKDQINQYLDKASRVEVIVKDSLNANYRNWQPLNDILRIIADSLQIIRSLMQGYTPTYPLAVSNFQGTASDSKISLSWDYPLQSDSVIIERMSDVTGGLFIRIASLTPPTNTYVDSPLTNNLAYQYRIRNFFNNQGSSPVIISNLIPEPPRQQFFFAIDPSSIDFNNLPNGNESNALDAETGTLAGFDSVISIGGTVSATQTSKIHGNLGYRFIFDGSPTSQVQLRKSLTDSDTMAFRFYVKFPSNRPFKDTTASQVWDLLNLKRVSGANVIVVVRSSNSINYLYRIGIFTGASSFNITLPTNTYNFITDSSVCIEYVLYRDATNGGAKVYWNGQKIVDTMGLDTRYYSMTYADFGKGPGGTVRMGEEFTIDDIIISNRTIGLYSAESGTATLTISNDSSYTMPYTISISSPFNINGSNLIDTSIISGERQVYTISVDTAGLAPGTYNKQIYITNLYSTQSISLTYTKSSAPPSGDEGSKGWFVDSRATGLNNGTSWTNAWTSLSNINWNAMSDGDTVYISGGTDSLIYETTGITIGRSNVTIAKGKSSGYNGRVILRNTGNIGSNVAISFDSKKNITIDGFEFVNFQKGISPRSRQALGVENIFVKNCKMYFTGDILTSYGDIEFFGTDHGGISDTAFSNRFNNIHILNNEFISPKWCVPQIDLVEGTNCWNVYVVGNKFINQNNSPNGHDDWYVANSTHTYILRNFYYYHNCKPRFGEIGNANGIGGGEKAGYNVIAFNIMITADSVYNQPVMGFYYPISNPNSYRRHWERMIVVNNTFFGTQGKIRLGADQNAYIVNNIFSRATTAPSSGKAYVSGNEAFLPIPDSIRYNAFMSFNQYSAAPTWIGGYSNSQLHSSNYAVGSTNPNDWYSPFTSGILKLSEPDSLVNDSYFIPDTTKSFYISGENIQAIIPQKVIDNNIKEGTTSWFEYYWNNAVDYFGNPYKNKIGAVQK